MVREAFGKKSARTLRIGRLPVELPVAVEQRHQRIQIENARLTNLEAHDSSRDKGVTPACAGQARW